MPSVRNAWLTRHRYEFSKACMILFWSYQISIISINSADFRVEENPRILGITQFLGEYTFTKEQENVFFLYFLRRIWKANLPFITLLALGYQMPELQVTQFTWKLATIYYMTLIFLTLRTFSIFPVSKINESCRCHLQK